MKDLVEWGVPDVFGSGEGNEWQGEPFTDQRNVAGAENRQRVRFHHSDVLRQLRGVVSRTRAIWASDEDQQRLRVVHQLAEFEFAGTGLTCPPTTRHDPLASRAHTRVYRNVPRTAVPATSTISRARSAVNATLGPTRRTRSSSGTCSRKR